MELKYDGTKENLGTNNYVHRIKRDATIKQYNTTIHVKAVCGTSVSMYRTTEEDFRYGEPLELIEESRRPCSKCFPKTPGAYDYIPWIED